MKLQEQTRREICENLMREMYPGDALRQADFRDIWDLCLSAVVEPLDQKAQADSQSLETLAQALVDLLGTCPDCFEKDSCHYASCDQAHKAIARVKAEGNWPSRVTK